MTTLPTSSTLPAALCEHDQWVCWREQARGENGKPTKVPINPKTGRFASTTDPETWTTFEEARIYALDKSVDGLGFVFSDDDPFVGVDLDDARNPETEEPDERTASIIDTLDSYTEISPSGTGYHVLIEGELPPGRNRRGTVECYETGRFFTVTGDHVESTPRTILERTDALYDVYRTHVADDDADTETTDRDDRAAPQGEEKTKTVESTDDTISLADEELLSRAQAADNGEKFSQLFDGHTRGYESHSEADMALACLLAFWTGGDMTQMDRLFRQSGLLREKWDEVHYGDGQTYGEKTLSRAVSVTDEYYSPRDRQGSSETQEPGPPARTGQGSTQADPSTDSRHTVDSSHQHSLSDRERDRIETIKTLEQRLRELENENDRLREERDALEATSKSEDERREGPQPVQGGLFTRLKRLFL